MATIAKLFHLIAVVHFYFGFIYDQIQTTEPDAKRRGFEFGGRMIYLTVWNMVIQCIYYTIALLNDFIGTNEEDPKVRPVIRKIRDYFFATFAFPFALYVGIVFHVLMIIDRSLVMPVEVDAFFPFWLNHLVHTNILIFIFIELFFFSHQYPSTRAAIVGFSILTSVYLGWILCVYVKADFWVYPILAKVNWPIRIIFLAFTSVIPGAFYFVGKFLNVLRWGRGIEWFKEELL